MNHHLQAIRQQLMPGVWADLMKKVPENLKHFLEQESADTAIREDRVNVELIPSQMMLLLAVYTGTLQWDYIDMPRLRAADTRYLLKHGLVYFDGELRMTPKGTLRVMQTLEGS